MDIIVDIGAARAGPATLSARDLSTPGWQLDPLRPSEAIVVVGGRPISVDAIGSVTVRNAAVRSETLVWIDPDDREYAAAEMTAALTTWLGTFAGVIDRRPRPPDPLGARDAPNGGRPLLLGSSIDTPTLEVRSCLYRRGCSPLVLDETTLPQVNGALLREGRLGAVPLTDIGAVYLRPDTCLGPAQRSVLAWTQQAHGVVVNRLSAMALNAAKPFQLAEIARHGLDIPPTIITTSHEIARAFAARHGQVVFKSLSGVRSIATELTNSDNDRLGNVGACPTMFQAFVPGVDVRVHVVGAETFACAIEADRLDYRYAARLSMRPVDINPRLRKQIVAMVRAMGLHVAGVDLRHRPDAGWTCLEVNPSPAFTWFTEYTGQPVAEAIAGLLLGDSC
jgi:glutathione synthase/RimK-type ligase-like ATP-grasp enzyme